MELRLPGNEDPRTPSGHQEVRSRHHTATRNQAWFLDPTPLLEGCDAIRTDRKGSGTHTRRGGGLNTYIKKGLQYSVPQCPAISPLEQPCTLLTTSCKRFISITNVYIPPESSTHTRDLSKLVASLPSAQSLICGNFNARSDERETALFQWAEDNSKLVLNDGTPTPASRNNQSPGLSSPDIDEPTSPCQGQCQSWTIKNIQRRSSTRISIVPLALCHIY